MKRILGALALLAGLLAANIPLPLHGAPGDLDVKFGSGGKVITAFGTSDDDEGNSVAVQRDGKILVAGRSEFAMALVRYLWNGNLDPSFGVDGKVTTDLATGSEYAQSVTVQPDGKILVAGNTWISADFALVRYMANGDLDVTFGNGGKVITDFNGSGDFARSVKVQSDGKILVAGYTSYKFAIARYNANGSLDIEFGAGGKVTTFLGEARGMSMALQPDGKIVVAGDDDSGSYASFALARYNSDGSLDEGFGIAGTLTTYFGRNAYGQSVAVQADGKIVVAGVSYSISGMGDFVLVRYTPDGNLDGTFGNGGSTRTDIRNDSNDVCLSVALQADGKIVTGGYSITPNSNEFAVVRYNANGTLDSTFGVDGKVVTGLGSGAEYGQGLLVQPDGNIVLAGNYVNDSNSDIALVRYEGGPSNPAITTDAGSAVSATSATLVATAKANNADTVVSFEYGTTASFGNTATGAPSPVTGLTPTAVIATVTGLLPHTTYYYRAKATNSQGTTYGEVARVSTFNTAPRAIDDVGVYDGSSAITLHVLANDSDADGDGLSIQSFTQSARGTVTASGSTLIYTAGEDFFGYDSFTYTLADGFGSTAVATVTIRSSIPITRVHTKGAAGRSSSSPGDLVPGELTPATFKTFGVPALNAMGKVAFLTTITAESGSIPAVFDGSKVVARKGDPAPGSNGASFQSFSDPALNIGGAVAFLGRLGATGSKAKEQGLYTSLGGSLVPVIRVGSELPGLTGVTLSRIVSFQLLSEALLFHGELSRNPAKSGTVLCSWTQAGGVQVLLRSGADLGGGTVKAITALVPASTSTGHTRYADSAVTALARVTFADGGQAVVQAGADAVQIIARTGDVVLGGPADAQWKRFGLPAINSEGATAFLGTLAIGPGGIDRASDTAIFAEIDDSPLAVIAREGQTIGDFKLGELSDPVHNSGGDVAALVTLSGRGVGRANDKAILYVRKNAAPELIARTGGELPGVPGAKLKSFRTLALPNDRGPLFIGTLAPRSGGVSTSNDTGLWAQDSNGQLHLLVREGANMDVGGVAKALKSFTVLALVPGSPNQTRAFNSFGRIVYRATFTDGSQALLYVHVP